MVMFTDRDNYRRAVADELRWRHLRHMPLPLLMFHHQRLHRPALSAVLKIVVLLIAVPAVLSALHLSSTAQWLVILGLLVLSVRIWRRRPRVR